MEGKSRGRSARLRFQIASRREFERLKASDPKTLTDLERAARFLYLQRLAFGGKVAGRNFGIDRTQPARFNIVKLASTLEAIHERLSGVVIEQLPWRNFIDRYDHPGMLFYLDPPYWGSEDDYGKGAFDRSEFTEMAERLESLKGRFLMSINDTPDIRTIFGRYTMDAVPVTYSISRGAPSRCGEFLISSPER